MSDAGSDQLADAGEKTPPLPERGMTPGEVGLAKSLFGCRINYHDVKIHHRAYTDPSYGTKDRVVTPENEIWYPEISPKESPGKSDYYHDDIAASDNACHRALFLHEMTHVLQHEGNETASWRVWLNPRDRVYGYNLDGKRAFKDYGTEQQASIVEDYYLALHHIKPMHYGLPEDGSRDQGMGCGEPLDDETRGKLLEEYHKILEVDETGRIRARVGDSDETLDRQCPDEAS